MSALTIFLAFAAGFIAANAWRAFPIAAFRPSMEWSPDSNFDDPFMRAAYKEAADSLGIRIKFGPPVPCPGYSLCGGMTGVWLHRDDVAKLKDKHEFTDALWKAHARLTS